MEPKLYKATKLSTLDKPASGKSEQDLEKDNKELFDFYEENHFISGMYSVQSGMSFTGRIFHFPSVGESLVLSGDEGLWTTEIKEITQETESKWLMKTLNSVYLVEILEDKGSENEQ